MTLTPLDIRNREFRKSFRGYDEEEVDEFLDRVVQEYERIYKENAEMKEVLVAKETNIGQYKDLEETLQKTLVIAQQTADELKQGAVREAEVIIKEAQLKAEQIIAGAEEKSKGILKEYEEIQKQAQVFKVKLRSFLQSQLDLIRDSETLATGFGDGSEQKIYTVADNDSGSKIVESA